MKLISLISEVFERMPSEDRKVLMFKRGVRFIAPITNNSVTEQVFIDPIGDRNKKSSFCRCSKCYEPHFTPKNGSYDIMVGIWLVCLSSDILKRSKEEALFTKANELAHAYLETAVDRATSRIPQEIDHPFYDTSSGQDRVIYSYETRQPLKLLAGEILKYNIYGEGAQHPNLIAFRIGNREYRLSTSSGSITVIGVPQQLMSVWIDFPRYLNFALKMTVESTVRRHMR